MQESKAIHGVQGMNAERIVNPPSELSAEPVPKTFREGQDPTETMKLLGHEIKTPLCLAKLYLQMAQRLSDHRTDQMRCLMERATEQIGTISRITDDFVQGFECPLSGPAPAFRRFDMILLLTETIDEAVLLYPGFSFELHGVKTACVSGERHKIKQVLNNYLNNAVKYSCGNKKVLISCESTAEAVTVTVKDFGTGIETGLSEKIFQRSYRALTEAVRGVEGNGYGLYIVSEIIAGHLGKVGVRSKSGQGSEFYFSLPASKEDLSAGKSADS
ncbi:sensor histidine kinase [Mucilaginibacter conchicola]|uniref:histidine kinase n=1 Tax=Mucilaginibacter conchicola TaxID=2303333 RepID=A0A372NRD4_9SPHI|nr:HAMP domain-containing sensor histidine kinase [Mucilaginibacter conchicola]RFZ91157.1 sensor histidine kinase [Mucilaginibacter conchicola]